MRKLKDVYPLYLANEAKQPNADLVVTDKYSGKPATRVALADAKIIDEAIAAAAAAAHDMARMPAYERQAVLQHCVDRFKERAEELAYALCVEAGKPIRDSRGEVSRLIDTFRIAAEESVRMTGEVQTLDISPRESRIGFPASTQSAKASSSARAVKRATQCWSTAWRS